MSRHLVGAGGGSANCGATGGFDRAFIRIVHCLHWEGRFDRVQNHATLDKSCIALPVPEVAVGADAVSRPQQGVLNRMIESCILSYSMT